MGQNTRGPAKLASITYPWIAKKTGYSLKTVYNYAVDGVFDARDMEACWVWINEIRAKKGLDMLGIPPKPKVDTLVNETLDVSPGGLYFRTAASVLKPGSLLNLQLSGTPGSTAVLVSVATPSVIAIVLVCDVLMISLPYGVLIIS